MSYDRRMDQDDDMRGERGGVEGDPFGLRRRSGRRKVCRFCADPAIPIDYKDALALRYFISDRGKIVPRRISGTCAYHQRAIALAVKRARNIALMPYTSPVGA
jgi:small subunit ribosomal protein S18